MEVPEPLPRDVIEDGDPMLVEMVSKLLAKKPDDRFQTATELMTMLDAAASALAAKGVLRDFGFRARSNSGARRMLRRVVRHLPRSLVARLTGRRVAMVMGLAFVVLTATLYLAFRSPSETLPAAQPTAPPPAPSNTPPAARVSSPVNAAPTANTAPLAAVPPPATHAAPPRNAPPSPAPRPPPKSPRK
jgi:hypothetical protein